MSLNFIEALFPEEISYGASGGPAFSTSIFTADSGAEQRNVNWSNFKGKYNVSQGVKSQEDMDVLEAFFLSVAKGKRYNFRFKDWADFEVENQTIGYGDGVTSVFQLIKTYTTTQAESGESYNYTRILQKINWETVTGLTVDGVGKASPGDYLVDHNTGLVTFTTAPANYSVIIVGYAEFHVPARFDVDQIDISQDFWETKSWPNIPVLEIRPVENPGVVAAVPLPAGTPSAVKAVHFDGTTTYLENYNLTASNSYSYSLSFWYRLPATTDTAVREIYEIEDGVAGRNNTAVSFNNHTETVAPTSALSSAFLTGVEGANNFQEAYVNAAVGFGGLWHHVLMSTESDPAGVAAPQLKIYLDGVDQTVMLNPASSNNMGAFAFSGSTFRVGIDRIAENSMFLGDMFDFWFAPGQSLLSGGVIPPATIEMFRASTGRPVSLGSDGSTPTGTAPAIFLTGDDTTFGANQGTGGVFAAVLGLTIATSDPNT